jgi:quercetin dioxygenase-like cupin family protein
MTMKKIISKRKLTLVLVLGAVTLCTVTAYALTTVRLAQGTIPFSELFNGPADVVMNQITMQPGDVIAWHYHPGRAYVIVKSGTITEDEGCGGSEVFSAGQAFEEPIPRVHQVRNTGTVPAELFTINLRESGQPGAIQTGGPLCGPPTNKDQCKDAGWMNFNFPRSFENQGDCIRFVKRGDRDDDNDDDDDDDDN